MALSSGRGLFYDPLMSQPKEPETPVKQPKEPETPDLEVLAARFLELWQDQLAAMALDPGNVEGFSRFYHLFADAALPAVSGADHSNAAPRKEEKDTAADPAPRPTAPGSSSGGSDVRADEFEKRLADLEKRLGALEEKSRPRR